MECPGHQGKTKSERKYRREHVRRGGEVERIGASGCFQMDGGCCIVCGVSRPIERERDC